MSKRYDIHEIADRLLRRSKGEFNALDGVWADGGTVSTYNFKEEEIHCTGAEREERNRTELEAFTKAMPDVVRDSSFHVCEQTGSIFEVARWTGTFNDLSINVRTCVNYRVQDGRLSRIDFYGDSVQSATMLEALLAGGWHRDPEDWKRGGSAANSQSVD